MQSTSTGLLAFIVPGWGPTSLPKRGGGRTVRIQPNGFTAGTNADG